MSALTEVSYDSPSSLPDASMLGQAAQRLLAIPEAAERDEAIATLFKLVDGILGAPDEPKKRRVKKANATFNQKVGRFAAAIDFLRVVGFLEGDDPDAAGEAGKDGLMFMPVAYLMRLTDAHHTLARAAQEAGIAAPPLPASGFNPYSSTVQASDTTQTAKVPQSWRGETQRVRDEVKKRQREMQDKVETAKPIDMQPTVFWLSGGRRLEEVIRETQESADDKFSDNALLQAQVASAKMAINGQSTKFESADKKLLKDLASKKVHEFCILRVICPDKSVLQAHFRTCEKGEQVLAAIAPLLSEHVRKAAWYIYQTPPLKRMDPKETMQRAGFSPGASLYLGFESSAKPEAPYFAPELASTLGPAPGALGGVAGAPGSFSGEAMGWGSGKTLGGAAAGNSAPAAGAAAAARAEDAGAGDPVPMDVTSMD